MAEESETQTATAATPTNDNGNGNTINSSDSVPDDNDPAWNYAWDEKLCKTTLKLIKPTVYTPPVLPLENAPDSDSKRYFVCPVEGCNKSFAKMHGTIFRMHLKRHLPDSQKPFKCNHPECTRAFVNYAELRIHTRIHTGERPYECEQCGKKFRRSNNLQKHVRSHSKSKNIDIGSSEGVGCDDSDDSESKFDDSSFSSLIPSDLDKNITESDTDAETDDEFHQSEIEEIKVEPETINEPLLPSFYSSSSSDMRVHVHEPNGGESLHAAKDFKFNNISSDSLAPMNSMVAVKHEINTESSGYFDPMELGVPMKQEINTEATDMYNRRFEDHNQFQMKNEPYFPDFYSAGEPTSMSEAIHRLAFEAPIASENIKTEFQPTNSIESFHNLDYQIPLPTAVLNNKSEVLPKKVSNQKSKRIEKPYKCSVEGCDRAFKVPYGLKRHSWVHTKVKTFECDQCKKKFLRKDHLAKHMKTHFRIQNPPS